MLSVDQIRQMQPRIGIVLGSGLSEVAEELGPIHRVPYADLPGLPMSGVKGHKGQLCICQVAGQTVLVAQGRSHLYEGHTAEAATRLIALLHDLGVQQLVLTNAAGCIREGFHVGGLMLIADHLNLTGTSPLLGGPHFQDMTEAYSKRLRSVLLSVAEAQGAPLHEGVYAGLLGPQYETPAEIRMLRTLGADAVGMSTVLETIRARRLGMEVAGISTLTNWAAGLSPHLLDHQEVTEVGQQAGARLAALLRGSIERGLT
jgi:purine-nucleoside phosphorylase